MPETWLRIASSDDVPVDGTLRCHLKGQAVCLYNVAGTVYATDDTCTHADASLADGFIVNGTEIECPYHQGRFDIGTGKATRAPCKIDLRTYPLKVIDGEVFMLAEGNDSPA